MGLGMRVGVYYRGFLNIRYVASKYRLRREQISSMVSPVLCGREGSLSSRFRDTCNARSVCTRVNSDSRRIPVPLHPPGVAT